MKFSKDFFIQNLGFDFEQTLKLKEVSFLENIGLQEKLKDNFFFYENPNQTNTSFYLTTVNLSNEELSTIRKYIWNENKANLILLTDKESLTILDAKALPTLSIKKCVIDIFNASEKDLKRIENIKRWKFDSGTFWINYHAFLKKAKYKSIDKVLVETLRSLKERLEKVISDIEPNQEQKEKIVQALIDRTLYVKYLEDNHIINSDFYEHYFGNSDVNYKTLLSDIDTKGLSRLFEKIHEIFNNGLFHPNTIDEKYLTPIVCDLLETSLNRNLEDTQLRLFDFMFDVIPVEFISYIYEIFLTKEQKENGIYYTPKKLAQLIVDDVIPKKVTGKILDPACGSGMFLTAAFQKLLENNAHLEPKNIEAKIEFRIKLLAGNIFGIEKQIIAQRFTLFSLSLQLFRGLDFLEVKNFIANQLKENKEITLFKKYSFFNNIIHANSLKLNDIPFEGKTFDYIVGNPPFFEIKQSDDEISFINSYKITIADKALKAKEVIGKHQISQCFLLKIKDWSNPNTRFGFVSNSSSFYNENSKAFQNFFYSHYNIEKIYELSRVKKILFEKATESVVTIVFSNQIKNDNVIEYYPVDLGLFSEKPFELLIIQEDKTIDVQQTDLLNETVKLRDFLIGNEFDRQLIHSVESNSLKLDFLIRKIGRGFQIWGEDVRRKEFNITKSDWDKLPENIQKNYLQNFIDTYFNKTKNSIFSKPYIKPSNLKPFVKKESVQFISTIDKFDRPRTSNIYEGKKLIFTRIGSKLNCVYSDNNDYFNFSIYTIKLDNNNNYYLICALLNAQIIEFFIDFNLRKRLLGSFSRIGIEDIKQIPIPKKLDENLVNQISKISKDLTESKYEYTDEVSEQLNDLIFDLYDLSYLEKQRIKDYFLPKTAKITNTFKEEYKTAFLDTVSIYLENPIDIEFSKTNFNLIVAKVYLNKNNSNTPSSQKTKQYILNEIFEQNPNENFIASNEKIFGKNCLYIIKKDVKSNWSETKAYEDGQELLKNLMPHE
jgi:type I restriction-modification system DNA methylase subunit